MENSDEIFSTMFFMNINIGTFTLSSKINLEMFTITQRI